MSSSHRRGPWSQGEDGYLVQLVHTQGALNWVRIAQLIGSRSPKQCRERYHQNLKPSLNHEPISPEEGLQIERMVGEMGKRWAEIARRLHGRSDNAVKNWWNGSMNRRRRVDIRRRPSTHQPSHYVERPQQFVRLNAANRPLSITSTGFPPRRGSGMDGPLPSPAVSEASRSESTDGAPSLVSDNSSAFSVSPRLAQPLYLDLPPLNSYPRDNRRPSLPMIPFRAPPNYASEGDSSAYTFTSRFVGESKTPAMNMHSPAVFQRTDYHMPPHSPRGYHTESRAQLLTAPPTPVQLPPLELNQQSDRRDPASERDTRMHLSSLLA